MIDPRPSSKVRPSASSQGELTYKRTKVGRAAISTQTIVTEESNFGLEATTMCSASSSAEPSNALARFSPSEMLESKSLSVIGPVREDRESSALRGELSYGVFGA